MTPAQADKVMYVCMKMLIELQNALAKWKLYTEICVYSGTCVSVRLKWAWNDISEKSNNSFPDNFHSLYFFIFRYTCVTGAKTKPPLFQPLSLEAIFICIYLAQTYKPFLPSRVGTKCVWLSVTQKTPHTCIYVYVCVCLCQRLCALHFPFFLRSFKYNNDKAAEK